MELLYVDDLVLIGETKELLLSLKKVRQWKEWIEKKEMRVNAEKTEVICDVR